ncbi:hypothetical protein FHY18_003233 [Xanthomonas arboricola]|nr:hypothetical protein [Xanthomonas sp. 3793]
MGGFLYPLSASAADIEQRCAGVTRETGIDGHSQAAPGRRPTLQADAGVPGHQRW